MKMKYIIFFIAALFVLEGCTVKSKEDAAESRDQNVPKNIILMIGDGMSLPQISAAAIVKGDALNLARFSVAGYTNTSSSDDLITDSAAGATALSSGVKTYNGAIGMDKDTVRVETVLEIAEMNGQATGLIATSSITHATPAGFYAHQPSRAMNEAIAYDLLGSGVDIFMGGGRKFFANRSDGLNLIDSLEVKNYFIAEKLSEINTEKVRAGLFISDEQPVSYSEGRGDFLPEATAKAIEFLNQKGENGFFLMVEGSQIDWGGHANDLDYVINEMLDFDRAIGKAMDFAEKDGGTLVIVTADHETGGLTLLEGSLEEKRVNGHFSTKGHTPLPVPVFAYGPGAELFGGIYENTEVFHKMIAAWENKKMTGAATVK